MKRVLSTILAFVLLFSVLTSVPITSSAESMYIRKIVSVVYDDSSSMTNGDKWAYANYAMQSFCGMLNSDDQLFITYMYGAQMDPNYKPDRVDLSAGGIQDSVDSIRTHAKGWSTPYQAVTKAFEKLESVQDDNPNTQYWLVVITDGEFSYTAEDDVNVPLTDDDKKAVLNKKFKKYAQTQMPNGTTPQITFLGIGDVAAPDEDVNNGIYTYSAPFASDATEIISAMNDMADNISGRTRLDTKDLQQIDSKTIRFKSSIPLLNIAAFTQKSDATIQKAVFGNEADLPISRKVSLGYPGYNDLSGGAFLIGDSQSVIGSGEYEIVFDKEVDAKDVVVLFEPALEMRMTVTLNGQTITDYDELDNAMEGDKLSVSCDIYEMGTDKRIDSSLMPPGTKYSITVSEEDKLVDEITGEDMLLSEYVLKNLETEVTASVVIDGFNPIKYKLDFCPVKYVPKVVYTMTSSFGGDVKSVKYDQIASNKDLSVVFTVYADGVAMTDPAAVKALNPEVSVSPKGNEGTVTYSNDGKIVYTPNEASASSAGQDSFDVDVTCTIDNGVSAKETYTVLIAAYQVIPIGTDKTVKKTGFFGNQTSVSFYITKDGVKLDKTAVENGISVVLNEEQQELKKDVSVASDGTITVTPYTDEEYHLNFWTWWGNWWHYFCLPDEDVNVTMSHSYGSASSTINVVPEEIGYQILCVYFPLAIELAVLGFIIWWIYAICAKPKFLPDAVLYIADLSYGGQPGSRYHEIDLITEVNLSQYNALKYRLAPKRTAKIHYVGKNLSISAGYGGSIICHSELWYKGKITPKNRVTDDLSHPQYVKRYIDDHDSLKIKVISVYDGADVHKEESIDNPITDIYYIHTDMANLTEVDGLQVIQNGTIFAYAIRLND